MTTKRIATSHAESSDIMILYEASHMLMIPQYMYMYFHLNP